MQICTRLLSQSSLHLLDSGIWVCIIHHSTIQHLFFLNRDEAHFGAWQHVWFSNTSKSQLISHNCIALFLSHLSSCCDKLFSVRWCMFCVLFPLSLLTCVFLGQDPAVQRQRALRQHSFFQLHVHLKRGQDLVARDACGKLLPQYSSYQSGETTRAGSDQPYVCPVCCSSMT